MKNRVPVRSRKDKHSTGSLVVGSVTTSESGLLYVFAFFLKLFSKKFPFDYIVPKSEPKVVEIPKVRVVLGVGHEDSTYKFKNLTINCVLYQNRFTIVSRHRIIQQIDLQKPIGVSDTYPWNSTSLNHGIFRIRDLLPSLMLSSFAPFLHFRNSQCIICLD